MVRRGTEESYTEYLTRLANAAGAEGSDEAALRLSATDRLKTRFFLPVRSIRALHTTPRSVGWHLTVTREWLLRKFSVTLVDKIDSQSCVRTLASTRVHNDRN